MFYMPTKYLKKLLIPLEDVCNGTSENLSASYLDILVAAKRLKSDQGKTSWRSWLPYVAEVISALDPCLSNRHFCVRSDYARAEQSFKGNTSFILGMIAAQLVARWFFNVPLLLDIRDQKLYVNSSSNKKTRPDYFGIDNQGNPYLIEAKGTIHDRVGNADITHAMDQLNNIQSITDASNHAHQVTYTSFKRHVVTSSINQKEGYLQFTDFDPENDGKEPVYFDLDKMVRKNYNEALQLISKNSRRIKMQGTEYICTDIPESPFYVGLDASIYDLFNQTSEGSTLEDNPSLYSAVTGVLVEQYPRYRKIRQDIEDEHLSIQSDGLCIGIGEQYLFEDVLQEAIETD